MDKQNRQRESKSMHAHVLNALKSMKQMTEVQVAEEIQKLHKEAGRVATVYESKHQVNPRVKQS